MMLKGQVVASLLLSCWLVLSCVTLVAAKEDVDLQRRNSRSTTTFTQEKCYTKVASTKKRHVHTTTQYSTTTSTVSVTVTSTGSTTTLTPSPTTITSTVTATTTTTSTNKAVTDTFTTTVTPTARTTTTPTITRTSTSTVLSTAATTTTSTSTVAAPARLTPAASQVASLGYQANQRRTFDAKVKRQLPRAPRLLARTPKAKKLCQSYPQSVTCKDTVKKVVHVTTTVSSGGSTATVTASKPTSTATTTTTKTSTSTVAPPEVSTTVTRTAATSTTTVTAPASTTTATSTTTTTQTQTTVSTSTAYAACQTNNVISKIGGQYVFNTYPNDANANIITGPSNAAADCCVACQQGGCNFWEFFNADQVAYGNQCYMVSDTTCPVGYEVDTDPNLAADEAGAFGNGACGQVQTIVRD